MIAAILALSVIVLVTVSDVSSTLLSNRTVFKVSREQWEDIYFTEYSDEYLKWGTDPWMTTYRATKSLDFEALLAGEWSLRKMFLRPGEKYTHEPVAVLKRSFLPIVEIYHGNKHRSRLYGQWGLFQSNYTIQFDKSAERTPIVGIGNFFSTEFTINDTIVATFKRKWTIIGIEYDVALETGTNLEEWLAYFLAYFLVEHGAL